MRVARGIAAVVGLAVLVLAGRIAFPASAPTPSPSPVGDLSIPSKTWVSRALPGNGKAPTDGKHQRAAVHGETGLIYFLGGDWAGPVGMQSGRQELYSYDVTADTWRLEYPYCGPAGALQPSHPDEVGWQWDGKRRGFWMFPGYQAGPWPGERPSLKVPFTTTDSIDLTWPSMKAKAYTYHLSVRSITGSWKFVDKTGATLHTVTTPGEVFFTVSSPAAIGEHEFLRPEPGSTMALDHMDRYSECFGTHVLGWGMNRTLQIHFFDPATRRWTSRPDMPVGISNEASKWTTYDPKTDSLHKLFYHGGRGNSAAAYTFAANAWKDYVTFRAQVNRRPALPGGTPWTPTLKVNDARLGQEYGALDVEGRAIWFVEPAQGALYRYDVDKGLAGNPTSLEYVIDTPARNFKGDPASQNSTPWNNAYPVWDSRNKVLLWPHIPGFSDPAITLWIYHPDTQVWERDAMRAPSGVTVKSNVFVYSAVHNVMVAMGRGGNVLWLYRYSP